MISYRSLQIEVRVRVRVRVRVLISYRSLQIEEFSVLVNTLGVRGCVGSGSHVAHTAAGCSSRVCPGETRAEARSTPRAGAPAPAARAAPERTYIHTYIHTCRVRVRVTRG